MQVVERISRADAHADATAAGDLDHRLQCLDHETDAVLRAAAIGILALVRARGQELRRQVTAGAVQFDTVESRRKCGAGGVRILGDDVRNLIETQLARHVEIDHPGLVRIHLAFGTDGGRGDGLSLGVLVQLTGNTPAMHELSDHAAALGAHRLGDGAPPDDLRLAVQSRRTAVTLAMDAWLRALADDQPGTGALAVILDVERSWHIALARSAARHRRHHDAVGELQLAELHGFEEV